MSRLKKKLDETDLELQDLLDDSAEDKILSPEEERKKKIQHRMTAAAMFLAVVVIAVSIKFSIKDNPENPEKESRTVKQTQMESVTEPETNALADDKYPEITELVQLYYDAKLTGDTNAIEKYVDNIEDVNMNEIKASNKYVKRYDNIECYTKSGLYDNTYVVYAYYEIKFKNIETMAPGIDVLYVIRDEETGSVYIHNGATANADIKNYIDALSEDKDVKELFDRTNQALEKALSEDSALNDLFKALQKGTSDAGNK